MFTIVLYTPQIPWNTGAIGRTCAALDARLVLIHPINFSLDDKYVQRAGMDYWPHVKLVEYADWDAFLDAEKPTDSEMFFLSSKVERSYYSANFTSDCYLIFGSETSGLPKELHDRYIEQMYTLPMPGGTVRSLNLANTATAVAYEAVRQLTWV